MNRNAAYAVGAAGLATIGVVIWRHSTQGTVSRMKAPFTSPIFEYELKSRHVSSPFGARRGSSRHTGVDLRTLFAPMEITLPNGQKATIADSNRADPNGIPGVGMELRSPVDGRVIDVMSGGPGGNEMIVRADDGTVVGFSHLERALAKRGEIVKAGDLIAVCGNTGVSTGPHLHLTVRDRDGILVDPAPFLGL